jgi:hypothetical protein
MNSIKRMVPQNSIIRRVRRHTAMATLFRSADPARLGFYPGSRPTPTQGLTGQAGVSFAVSASQPSAGVAEAILLPASSSLPTGHVIGTPSVTGAATFSMGYPMQRTPVPATAVEPTPARAPEARPSPTTLRQAQDTAPPETGSKTENAEWRRLQTIFSKHQDKQAAEEMASESEIPTASTQRKPESEKTPSVRREASQPRRQESEPGLRPPSPDERRRQEPVSVSETLGTTKKPPTAQTQNEPLPRPVAKVGREAVQAKRLESEPHPTGSRRAGGGNVWEEASRTVSAPADTPPLQKPPVEGSVGEPRAGQPVTAPDPPIPGSPPDLVERSSVEQPHRRAQSDERDKPAAEVETSVPQRSTGPDMEETVERTAIMGEPEMIPVPEAEAPDRTLPESFVQLQAEIGESPQQASHRSVVRPFDEAQGRPRSPQKEEISERDVFHTDTLEPTILADITKTSTPPDVEAEEGTLLSESQLQPLPLQAVWPVQRLEEPTLSPSPEPPAMSTSVSTSASEPEPLEPVRDKASETAEIRKALRDVAPGQPTDSSIEIIPPRRPRPQPWPARAGQRDREQSRRVAEGPRPEPAWPESLGIAQDKLRRRVEGPHPEPAEGPRPELVDGPRPVAPPSGRQLLAEPGTASSSPGEATSWSSPVQMRPDGGSDAAQSRTPEEGLQEPELVQTEIGPLPADLWHLLGQSPPRLHPEPVEGQSPHGVEPEPAPSRPAPPTTDGEAAVKRAVAAAEARPVPPASPTSEQLATQGGSPSVIQRRPDEAGVDTGSAAGAEAGGAETETAAPPGERDAAEEPDVDELARRVYAEIKRRLSVEWERVRRRE